MDDSKAMGEAQAVRSDAAASYAAPVVRTLNNSASPHAICAANGWVVGTILAGDEGYGETRIQITAIGERSLLALRVADPTRRETSWVLWCRDWRDVGAA